eukprot:6258966-Amphidinium_carterae.1
MKRLLQSILPHMSGWGSANLRNRFAKLTVPLCTGFKRQTWSIAEHQQQPKTHRPWTMVSNHMARSQGRSMQVHRAKACMLLPPAKQSEGHCCETLGELDLELFSALA